MSWRKNHRGALETLTKLLGRTFVILSASEESCSWRLMETLRSAQGDIREVLLELLSQNLVKICFP
jgi:hypothetical protein